MTNNLAILYRASQKNGNSKLALLRVNVLILLGFTHVIRLALGGQAKSEHGYRIESITYHSY